MGPEYLSHTHILKKEQFPEFSLRNRSQRKILTGFCFYEDTVPVLPYYDPGKKWLEKF